MWSYGLDLRSIRLTVVKVVVSSVVAKYLIFLQAVRDF